MQLSYSLVARAAPFLVVPFLATSLAQGAPSKTSFAIHRLNVAGNKDVEATAINNRNEITATVFDAGNGTQSGVIIHQSMVTTLPVPYKNSGVPIPEAINARGDVLGYTYEGYQPVMFLWQSGQYLSAAQIPLEIEQQAGPPPLPISLNIRDEVAYTIITGQQNPTDPIYGKLAKLHSMPTFLRYQTAHSINRHGMIAGTTFYEGNSEVFVGKGKTFTVLLPPGARTAAGGFVNDAGEVAGSYIDASNVQHGFTWQNGAFTSYDLPEKAQPYSLSITGLNNNGRAVGTYTSQAGNHVRGFLYNGSTATAFGDFNRNDTVTVAMNDHGTLILTEQINGGATQFASFRVDCSGSGC